MLNINDSSATNSDVNLVEQILEQGQRLRNAMVQTILNNDPFNVDVTNNKSLKCSFVSDDGMKMRINSNSSQNNLMGRSLTIEEKHKFLAYLRGERMSKQDENKVLETFRVMSNEEICDATDRSCSSDYSCKCDTCKQYYKHNLSCDFNHSSSRLCKDRCNIPPLDLYQKGMRIKECCRNFEYLKYVDSLKISVHSLLLNQEGHKKVYGLDTKIKLPVSISHTYFIEYNVPDILTKCIVKSKAKVDSGLDSTNLVRMCSKKLQNEAIYFKQTSLHEVVNLQSLDLSSIDIKFNVSCRTLKHKNSNLLGVAKFHMSSFLDTKYLNANQELTLMLNNEAPIALGTVKVSLQLGCGQLYFGKEFFDAIQANKENISSKQETDIEENSPVTRHHNSDASLRSHHCKENEYTDTNYEIVNKKLINGINKPKDQTDQVSLNEVLHTKPKAKPNKKIQDEIIDKHENEMGVLKQLDCNKEIIFGFIYLSEAQYFCDVKNTFVTCQPFCQDDVLCSRVIYSNLNPIYNFQQIIPFVYDDELLNKLRDNYMVVEFWEKLESQHLIGICKISLHQFYLAFRNPIIVKYLARNKLPVIGCDWWEPICDPLNEQVYGQAQFLVALGTDVQINNLEIERGFKKEIVTAKTTHAEWSRRDLLKNTVRRTKVYHINPSNKIVQNKAVGTKNKCVDGTPTLSSSSKTNLNKVDVGVQSSLQMEEKTNEISQPNPVGQDLLGCFLAQFVQQKNICVEKSTNTDSEQIIGVNQNVTHGIIPNSNSNVRKTSDLLDSLQNALVMHPQAHFHKTPNTNETNTFKAHILIENALHLPSRKKYKCKKSRGKNTKPDEILPNTYVTFDTLPNDELKSTNIVQKSKNPEWDYECDVSLPVDLLIDPQKRLIFKVWKKSSNTSQPNVHADSVLGFAGVDLTVLLAGLPTVSGWFNIVDFSNKCNGQIKITVTPLENLSKFNTHKRPCASTSTSAGHSDLLKETVLNTDSEKIEEPEELLSRALKRKFTELDEITQRLRLRLSYVTNDLSDTSNDDFVDQFERDMNTLCVEDDYDTVNFENSSALNTQDASTALLQIQDNDYKDPINVDSDLNDLIRSCDSESIENVTVHKISNLGIDSNDKDSSSTSILAAVKDIPTVKNSNLLAPLDEQLLAGKQRIDTLLQKLSLFTENDTDAFGSRYVSGCSSKQNDDIQLSTNVLKKLKIDTNSDTDLIVNPLLFHDLHSESIDTTPLLVSQKDSHVICDTSSSNSLLTQFSEYRPNPDGDDNISNDVNTSSTTT